MNCASLQSSTDTPVCAALHNPLLKSVSIGTDKSVCATLPRFNPVEDLEASAASVAGRTKSFV